MYIYIPEYIQLVLKNHQKKKTETTSQRLSDPIFFPMIQTLYSFL